MLMLVLLLCTFCPLQLVLQSSVFWDAIEWDQATLPWDTIHQPLQGELSLSFYVTSSTQTNTAARIGNSDHVQQQKQQQQHQPERFGQEVPQQQQQQQQQQLQLCPQNSSTVPRQMQQQQQPSTSCPQGTTPSQQQQEEQQQPNESQAAGKAPSAQLYGVNVPRNGRGDRISSSSSETVGATLGICTPFNGVHCSIVVIDGIVKLELTLERGEDQRGSGSSGQHKCGSSISSSSGIGGSCTACRADGSGMQIFSSSAAPGHGNEAADAVGNSSTSGMSGTTPQQQQQSHVQQQQQSHVQQQQQSHVKQQQSHVQQQEPRLEGEASLNQHPSAAAEDVGLLFMQQQLHFDQLLPLTERQLKVRFR